MSAAVATPNTIEEPEPELLLKIVNLSRKGRLGNTQMQGRLRDSAQLSHRDKCSQAPQVHSLPYSETA